MCNVCVAYEALSDGFTYGHPVDGHVYAVRATGEAEFKPVRYQVKREGEDWPDTWLDTDDLAGAMTQLGFDHPVKYCNPGLILETYNRCR